MCGNVGVAGEVTVILERVFEDLLFMDTLRGGHSTGVVSVPRVTNNVKHYKQALPAMEAMQTKEYADVMRPLHRVLIGHNRHATAGAINDVNAHPFDHGNIIGVHNGTLRGQHLLPDHRDFEVDSENIMYAIDKEGIEETAKKLHGAFALVWWDKEAETLNFLRNSERPLFYRYVKDKSAMIWSSERYLIDAAAKRRKVDLDDTTYYCKEGDLISTHIPYLNYSKDMVLDERYTITPLDLYTPPADTKSGGFGYANSLWDDEYDDYDYPYSKKLTKKSNIFNICQAKKEAEVLPKEVDFVEGPSGLMFSEATLKTMSSQCGWCLDDISEDSKVTWVDPATPLCKLCTSYVT